MYIKYFFLFFFIKILRSFEAFLLLLALTKVHSEDVNVECRFSLPPGTSNYLCEVSSIDFNRDDESQRFVFGGRHIEGRTNADVTHVTILNSQVPFVIPQIFPTFPNLIHLIVNDGGLRRIQSNAIVDARNLQIFTARNNSLLTTVQSNAFAGATNLIQLILNNNAITDVHEKAFVGLQRARVINLTNNFIKRLPDNVFRPARRLQTLFFRNNRIDTIYASMFAHNNIMHQVELQDNQINAVDRRFFTPIRELHWLFMLRNVCVNRSFRFGDNELVAAEMKPCFDNFDRMSRDVRDEI